MKHIAPTSLLLALALTVACGGSDDGPLGNAQPLSDPTPEQRERIQELAYGLAMGQTFVPLGTATQTQACPDGGSVKISDNYGEGQVFFTVTFDNCADGNTVINGTARMSQTPDGSVMELEFDNFSVQDDDGEYFGFDGLYRIHTEVPRIEIIDLKIYIDGGYVVVNADLTINANGTLSGWIEFTAGGTVLGRCDFDNFSGTLGEYEASCTF